MPTNVNPKIYNWIYFALIFLALGVMTSPTLMGGYHIFILVPALYCFAKTRLQVKLNPSSWVLLILAVWGSLSFTSNFDSIIKPGKSIREIQYYLYAVLCIYPFRLYFRGDRNEQYKRLLHIFMFTIICAFFVGIIESWFKFDLLKFKAANPESTYRSGGFYNYMRYGYGSALIFILLVGLNYLRENKFVKNLQINQKLLFAAAALSGGAVATSQCRGALLGLLCSFPFLVFRFQPKITKILVTLVSCFLLFVGYFTLSKNTDLRFLNVLQGSNSVRISQWQTAISVMKDNPIFGVGPDQFSYNVKEYKHKYGIPYDYYSGHAHNTFLEHGASYGVMGIVLFFLFIVMWFRELWSIKDDVSWIIMSYVVGYAVSGQVELLMDVVNSHILFFIYSISQVYIIEFKKRQSL